MSDAKPPILDYASPVVNRPRQKVSWYLASYGSACGVFMVGFRPFLARVDDPLAQMLPQAMGVLIWIASVFYIWLRVFEDRPRLRVLAAFMAICGTIMVIAVPLQLSILGDDPGFPRPRFRLELLWWGIIASIALCGFIIGRLLQRLLKPVQADNAGEIP